jgi:transcriptional regulator with XRE-family HTH domain
MPKSTAPVSRRPVSTRRRSPDKEGTRKNGAAKHTPPEAANAVDVGRRLRTLRTEHKLSIRALAEKSGLNVNTLSLIENAKTSPSVSTLQQLATALGVPIVAFFETEAPKRHLLYVKAGERANAVFAHGTLADLGTGMAERTIEPFVLTLGPNMGSGQQPIVHTGHEFVFCLKGRLLYTIEDQSYVLTEGDSLLFEAHLPHRWQNVDEEATQALLVLCPADARDEPTALHFAMTGNPISTTQLMETK